MHDGASKYGKWNWRGESVAVSVYIDACFRHLLDWYHGEEEAEDSGAHHLGHAIACLAIILDAQGTGNLIDDRPAVDQECSELFAKLAEKIKRINELREPAKHVTRNEVTAKGCCAPSIYSNTQEERVVDYYGVGEAVKASEPGTVLDARVKRTECILGHKIDFIDEDDGYIDGKKMRGTEFKSLVELYRQGYEYVDDRIADQSREEQKCEQPAT